MRRGHAAYESLAGAIVLGEATEAERAAYLAHAATCPRCEVDLDATRTLVCAAFTASQHGETWRASVRDEVFARIDRRSATWSSWITNGLAVAVALTLALNVALLLGAGRSWSSPSLATVLPATAAAAPAAAGVGPGLDAARACLDVAGCRDRLGLPAPQRPGIATGHAAAVSALGVFAATPLH